MSLWATESAYPAPRERAAPSIESGIGPVIPPPTTRHYQAMLSVNVANSRSTVVSPAYHGPALITHYRINWATPTNAGPEGGVLVQYSTSSDGDGKNVPRLPLPTGAKIIDTDDACGAGAQTLIESGTLRQSPNTAVGGQVLTGRLDKLIMEPEWFLKVSLVGDPGVTVYECTAHFTILERIDPSIIIDML